MLDVVKEELRFILLLHEIFQSWTYLWSFGIWIFDGYKFNSALPYLINYFDRVGTIESNRSDLYIL